RNLETKTPKEKLQALLAMANFVEEASRSSMYQTIHQDYQEICEAVMITDNADHFEFIDKAILIMQFTNYFRESFENVNWTDASRAANELRDHVSLQNVGHE